MSDSNEIRSASMNKSEMERMSNVPSKIEDMESSRSHDSSSANCANSNNKNKTIKFIVSGFGPFHGVQDNPTSEIVAKLIPFLQQQHKNDPSCYYHPELLATNTRTMIIETSAEGARKQIDTIAEEIRIENASNDSTTSTIVVVLHLGVNTCGTSFELERCAYNDATFRVPDERGYCPYREPIIEGIPSSNSNDNAPPILPIGTRLNTLLNVSNIIETIRNLEPNGSSSSNNSNNNNIHRLIHPSTDPGRFVCNYTYCYSLNKFDASELHDNKNARNNSDTNGTTLLSLPNATNNSNIPNVVVRCLFMHVPPFSIVPEEQQLRMVATVMNAIRILQMNEE